MNNYFKNINNVLEMIVHLKQRDHVLTPNNFYKHNYHKGREGSNKYELKAQ